MTAVTLAELSVGPLVATTRKERAARQAVLQQAEADFQPLPFDADAARAYGRVAASLRADGRKVQACSYDAMIAATAIANELPLYTVNPDDFSGIDGLDLRPIPHPDQPSSST
jgi:predicted nucleic acid-binding protein